MKDVVRISNHKKMYGFYEMNVGMVWSQTSIGANDTFQEYRVVNANYTITYFKFDIVFKHKI